MSPLDESTGAAPPASSEHEHSASEPTAEPVEEAQAIVAEVAEPPLPAAEPEQEPEGAAAELPADSMAPDEDDAEEPGWNADADESAPYSADEGDDDESDGGEWNGRETEDGAREEQAEGHSAQLFFPAVAEARSRVLGLNYPPTTLILPPARAVGHILAAPVVAKSNLPLRPFATVDGLAVNSADLLLGRREREPRQERRRGRGRDRGRDARDEAEASTTIPAEAFSEFDEAGNVPVDENLASAESMPEPAETAEAPEASAEGQQNTISTLRLRPAPQTSRRDDSVAPGEAVPIAVGDEVPRGCDFVVPFAALEPPPGSTEPPPLDPEPVKWIAREGGGVNKSRMRDDRERQAAMRRDRDKQPAAEADGDSEDDDLPAREPPREWDLAQYYQEGTIELPRVERLGGGTLVSIGSWARNRDELLSERALLRAGEVALLEALGVSEVEVYRRPVVGIASLSEPLPSPNRQSSRSDAKPRRGGRASEAMQMAGVSEATTPEKGRGRRQPPPNAAVDEAEELEDLDLPSGICPLTQLCMHLCRSAQVAALPLGYAPKRFRPLSLRIERWLSQVDILLIVGGSHHGPRCLTQDIIATYGRLAVAGADVLPGGNLSAGSLAGKPVFSMPGSLPEVLAGFVLFVRPLLHRYFTPLHFQGELPLTLEQGRRIRFAHNTAVGLRYGYNAEKHCFYSRYGGPARGRDGDTWMEYVRGQALAVFEGGREYEDGESITVYPY